MLLQLKEEILETASNVPKRGVNPNYSPQLQANFLKWVPMVVKWGIGVGEN
jgi:hypothetical protein